jgi:lysozyme
MSAETIERVIDNSKLSMSDGGLAKLKSYEGVQSTYYNDPAGHCTYGVGTLVHRGACTAEESQMTVSDEVIDSSLQKAIDWAQKDHQA